MTAKVQIRDGAVVEDTMNDKTAPSVPTEMYVWIRIQKNRQAELRYGVRDHLRESDDYDDSYTLPSDCDIVQWHKKLANAEKAGVGLGAIQGKATDYTSGDYFSNNSLGTAIPAVEASESEQEAYDKAMIADGLNDRDSGKLTQFDSPVVPQLPDGGAMPLLVMGKERGNDAIATFDEAKDKLESFLDHLEVRLVSGDDSSDDESSSEQSDSSGDSDQDKHWLRGVDGIGSDVMSNIREHTVSEQETLHHGEFADVEEWRNSPIVVTEQEANERLQAVAAEMPTGAFTIATDKIGEGEIDEAITLIEDYE